MPRSAWPPHAMQVYTSAKRVQASQRGLSLSRCRPLIAVRTKHYCSSLAFAATMGWKRHLLPRREHGSLGGSEESELKDGESVSCMGSLCIRGALSISQVYALTSIWLDNESPGLLTHLQLTSGNAQTKATHNRGGEMKPDRGGKRETRPHNHRQPKDPTNISAHPTKKNDGKKERNAQETDQRSLCCIAHGATVGATAPWTCFGEFLDGHRFYRERQREPARHKVRQGTKVLEETGEKNTNLRSGSRRVGEQESRRGATIARVLVRRKQTSPK